MLVPRCQQIPPAINLLTHHRGFTLVELLVAVGVTATVIALMLSVTMSTLTLWNQSTGHLQSANSARQVLDAITSDLQAAILRRDTNAWLVATLQRDQTATQGDTGMDSSLHDRWNKRTGTNGKTKPFSDGGGDGTETDADHSFRIPSASSDLQDYRFGRAGVWLRFFSTPSDNANATAHNASAPRAIAYRIARCRPTNGLARYYLFRSEVRPFHNGGGTIGDSTFEVGYNLLMDVSISPGYNTGSGTDQNSGNITRPTAARLIATEVVDFGVRLHERAPDGTLREVFPCQRDPGGSPLTGETSKAVPFSYASSAASSHPETDITGPITYGFPVIADIFIRILTPQGFKILQLFEEEDADRFPGQTWWDIVEEHSKIFTRRVTILSEPL